MAAFFFGSFKVPAILGFRPALVAALTMLQVGAAAAAEDQDALDGVRRLAEEGARELALSRAELLQPPSADQTRWVEWESLRIELLERLGRREQLLKAASSLPEFAPVDLTRRALLAGAEAGNAVAEPAQARGLLARLLWGIGLPAEGLRPARMMVIDTFLLEKRPADAYRAMLRFQQDYQPLSRSEGEHFARSLADQGAFREAATWLLYLEGRDPVRLLVQLETGLVSPKEAAGKARAELVKAPSLDWWRVFLHAAGKLGDAALQVEASERLLNHPGGEKAVSAAAIREQYEALAGDIGNREHLLRGEDSAWINLAASILSSSPSSARAVLAMLAARGRSPAIREAALDQWLASMQRQKLGLAAARYLAGAGEFTMRSLVPDVRRALGEIALSAGEAALASDYWQGLPAPAGTSPEAWALRVAWAAAKAGRFDDADRALGVVYSSGDPMGTDTADGLLGFARLGLEKKQDKRAEIWLETVAGRATGRHRREALMLLGPIAEQRGDYSLAAQRYLLAATVSDTKVTDTVSIHARWRAARCLALAGFRTDAREQFERVRKTVKERALQELIKLEMDRL